MRTVGRTAVIAGTASAVSGRVNRRQQQKFAEQEAQAQPAAPPAAPAEPAVADSDELISKLKELATLKDQGILTDEEFNAQKAKILAQMS
ncbi:MAG TPA: SHOCT domain-containing protein [Acidimicrobiales bacterium]|nr:SHOCT domain-containing protein [Acidimicrobiales bacterium]